MSKPSSARCQIIEHGGLHYRVPLGTQAIPPHVIAYDEDDIGSVHVYFGEDGLSTINSNQGFEIANFNISATILSPSSSV